MARKHLFMAGLIVLGVAGTGFVSQIFAQHTGHGGAAAQPAPKEEPAEAAEEEAPTVEIPLEKQQLIGVKTVAVALKSVRKTIRTVGRVESDERRLATVAPKFEGWIEKLFVDYTGSPVRRGQPLAEVYSPELFATQQEFLTLLKWKTKPGEDDSPGAGSLLTRDADSLVEAARQRLRLWDISDEQIKAIEETGKPIRTMVITSPADGVVIRKEAIQGMRFMSGEKLFDIADLSTVWILADIYEYELPLVKTGGKARVKLSSIPGREFIASIEFVAPVLSGETRTAKVRLSLPNPEGKLRPQMFTNVELSVDLGKRLVIPEDAVIDTGTRQIVYVDKGEGYFEPRQVTLGARGDGFVEVLAGVKPGQKVVSAATFLVDSEARLKGIVK